MHLLQLIKLNLLFYASQMHFDDGLTLLVGMDLVELNSIKLVVVTNNCYYKKKNDQIDL